MMKARSSKSKTKRLPPPHKGTEKQEEGEDVPVQHAQAFQDLLHDSQIGALMLTAEAFVTVQAQGIQQGEKGQKGERVVCLGKASRESGRRLGQLYDLRRSSGVLPSFELLPNKVIKACPRSARFLLTFFYTNLMADRTPVPLESVATAWLVLDRQTRLIEIHGVHDEKSDLVRLPGHTRHGEVEDEKLVSAQDLLLEGIQNPVSNAEREGFLQRPAPLPFRNAPSGSVLRRQVARSGLRLLQTVWQVWFRLTHPELTLDEADLRLRKVLDPRLTDDSAFWAAYGPFARAYLAFLHQEWTAFRGSFQNKVDHVAEVAVEHAVPARRKVKGPVGTRLQTVASPRRATVAARGARTERGEGGGAPRARKWQLTLRDLERPKVGRTEFRGTTLSDVSSMIYLLRKYGRTNLAILPFTQHAKAELQRTEREAARYSNGLLWLIWERAQLLRKRVIWTWDTDAETKTMRLETNGIRDGAELGKMIDELPKERWCVLISLSLQAATEAQGHANMLIVDRRSASSSPRLATAGRAGDGAAARGTVHRIEPNGAKADNIQTLFRTPELDRVLEELWGAAGFTYVFKPPIYGLQMVQASEPRRLVAFPGDPNGFCLAWCYFIADLRLQPAYADRDLTVLQQQAIEHITHKHGDNAFTEFIRNYAQDLVRHLDKLRAAVRDTELQRRAAASEKVKFNEHDVFLLFVEPELDSLVAMEKRIEAHNVALIPAAQQTVDQPPDELVDPQLLRTPAHEAQDAELHRSLARSSRSRPRAKSKTRTKAKVVALADVAAEDEEREADEWIQQQHQHEEEMHGEADETATTSSMWQELLDGDCCLM